MFYVLLLLVYFVCGHARGSKQQRQRRRELDGIRQLFDEAKVRGGSACTIRELGYSFWCIRPRFCRPAHSNSEGTPLSREARHVG